MHWQAGTLPHTRQQRQVSIPTSHEEVWQRWYHDAAYQFFNGFSLVFDPYVP